jgi:multicomponent Na+:H+ antiporter subunit G
MRLVLTAALMLIGAAFSLLAALGAYRMPDVFTRMQATAKSGTMGVGCLMLAVAIYFAEASVGARALAVVAFLVLTAPVASHMIGRAAYFTGVPLWEGTHRDDLRGRYDPATHICHSPPLPPPPELPPAGGAS